MAEPLPNRDEELPDERYYNPSRDDSWAEILHDALRELSINSLVTGPDRSEFEPYDGTLYIPTNVNESWSRGTGDGWVDLEWSGSSPSFSSATVSNEPDAPGEVARYEEITSVIQSISAHEDSTSEVHGVGPSSVASSDNVSTAVESHRDTEVHNAAQPPQSHDLGSHDADTLATLNAIVSDATLDDSGAERPPASHDHSGGTLAHTGINSALTGSTLLTSLVGDNLSIDGSGNLNAAGGSTGGAPTDASYVTLNDETGLDSETQHANIVEADRHPPAEHDNTSHSAAFLNDGDGVERTVWVIAAGASDPAGADPEDIIFEEES